jgi:GNAT superfamily N-acetyltransferase
MKARIRAALIKRMGQVLDPACCAEIELELLATEDLSIDPAQFGAVQCGRLTFKAERFADILPELHELHKVHWTETEKHRHGLAMNPDYDGMAAQELAGQMVQFTARHETRLVGNLRMYVRTSMHTQTLYALEDTLYLTPDYRGGRNALRFMEYVERALKRIGVREIRADTKNTAPAGALLMKHMGYQAVATQYVKFLED